MRLWNNYQPFFFRLEANYEHEKKVLFFCKHNSSRSQIAEAYLRNMAGDKYEVYSAGLEPEPIHPFVYIVMQEEGIDISGQTSKDVAIYIGKQSFNQVIIVCQEGEAECPKLYPFAMHIERWAMPDPAEITGDKEDVMQAFRHTRDEIKRRIQNWLIHNNG